MNSVQIRSYLSSIIWTSGKLQENLKIHTIHTQHQCDAIKRIDSELNDILIEETTKQKSKNE